MLFFFFQAEDGIRDVAVTGVQTCALPISREGIVFRGGNRRRLLQQVRRDRNARWLRTLRRDGGSGRPRCRSHRVRETRGRSYVDRQTVLELGRAVGEDGAPIRPPALVQEGPGKLGAQETPEAHRYDEAQPLPNAAHGTLIPSKRAVAVLRERKSRLQAGFSLPQSDGRCVNSRHCDAPFNGITDPDDKDVVPLAQKRPLVPALAQVPEKAVLSQPLAGLRGGPLPPGGGRYGPGRDRR